jgi:hypothetical protein
MTDQSFSRRWRWRVIGLVLLSILGHFLHREWQFWKYESRLQRAIDEANRTDPDWQEESLRSPKEKIEEGENLACVIRFISDRYDESWSHFHERVYIFGLTGYSLNEHWDQTILKDIDSTFEANLELIRLARSLILYQKADFGMDRETDSSSAKFNPFIATQRVTNLLLIDGIRWIEQNQPPQAILDIQAMLNISQSMTTEPFPIASKIRYSTNAKVTWLIKKLLAMTEPDEESLKPLIQRFLQESDAPMFLDELRNERRLGDLYFRNLQSDSFDLKHELMKLQAIDGESIGLTRFQTYLHRPYLSLNHAIFLEELNDRIEEIRENGPELKIKREEIPETKRLAIAKNRMPIFDNITNRAIHNTAILRCAATAIAVELYRRRHSQWPDSLEQLDRDLLPSIPIDPFTNQYIQLFKQENGRTVFCNPSAEQRGPNLLTPAIYLFDLTDRRKPCTIDLELLPLPRELMD